MIDPNVPCESLTLGAFVVAKRGEVEANLNKYESELRFHQEKVKLIQRERDALIGQHALLAELETTLLSKNERPSDRSDKLDSGPAQPSETAETDCCRNG